LTPPDNSIQHDEIPLTGVLSEFRSALREEIEAARRNESSAAVPLINGRRIAQVGNNYQYVFDVENILNLPGDTPGDLYVPGRAPLNVIIISVDGMAITVSVPEDLGTIVPTARLQSNLAHLMRKLIERIEALANRPNPTGERVRGALPVSGSSVVVNLSDEFNPDQIEAVASSLGRDTTFIWGPPGTGKTRTIGAIAEQLYRRGRSVLVVSHTNTAVDQAILRIGNKIAPDDLAKGRVLRVGEPKDLQLKADLLLQTHVAQRSEELANQRDALKVELAATTADVIQVSRKIEICEWVSEAKTGISAMTADLESLQKLDLELDHNRRKHSRLSATTPQWTAAAEVARYAQSLLVEMAKVDEVIAEMNRRLLTVDNELEEVKKQAAEAKAVYAETTSVGWLIRNWRRLPSPEQQLEVLQKLQGDTERLGLKLEEVKRSLGEAESKRTSFAHELEIFQRKYSSSPDEVLRQATTHRESLDQLNVQIEQLAKTCSKRRLKLEELLMSRLSALKDWGFTRESAGPAELMLSAIKDAYEAAVYQIASLELAELQEKRNYFNKLIRNLEAEIRQIEESLQKIEELVIAEAMIIATTLTRAYLRDSIQSRRFDTVILDEASMAPIPALWVAASLADANAVVVGDSKQLPPIVLSQNNLAKKWLGKDIFDAAGLSSYDDNRQYLVTLKTQYRMHPRISAIPNELIYRFLTDGRINYTGRYYSLSDAKCDENLMKWYRSDWGHDYPVLLVNTASVGAWVTSVSHGTRASRLNFLSATICVDLAEQLLLNNRPKVLSGEPPRILIICPYRPHARLLKLLLRDQNLNGEVRAGTVHNFQGSEADVVILDLVNDEPHWRVGMFDPKNDGNISRLLNVALTRARRRLVVVGDFEYISKLSKKSFLGAELIPYLQEHYPCVDALDVIPVGLAARAAKAQTSVLGGDIEPDATRLVVTQEHFYSLLCTDLGQAKRRIVIYSAFITPDRLGQLEPPIRAAIERGVRIYVVTKARDDRSKQELRIYQMLERTLNNWGVIVIHKRRMHEKLVFIDDEILWMGSLNPLSFSNTQEVMERRASRKVVDDFIQTLRLNELIGEYDHGSPTCPICRNEVVASEGTNEPFYWRCVEEGCYSRSIDQPPLEDGVITCTNCGREVEFGDWGGKPHWRCIENRQHRQKIAHTHLLLPKMRGIIPKRELRKLDKLFGITFSTASSRDATVQAELFDLDMSKPIAKRLEDIKSKTRILLVEDEESIYQVILEEIQERFSDFNIDLIYFDDCSAALDFLQKNQVDVVISCLVFPGIDGITFLNICKNLYPATPFIVHTALTDYKEVCMARGADAYVVKSVDLSELTDAIIRLIDQNTDN